MSGLLEKVGFFFEEYLWHVNVGDEGNNVWMSQSHEARHLGYGSSYSHPMSSIPDFTQNFKAALSPIS